MPDKPPDLYRLLAAAKHHARGAHGKVASADQHVRMEAVIHAGAAVELMAKAVIVSRDPEQIMRSRKRGPAATIRAIEAVDAAAVIVVELDPYVNGAKRTLNARNAAAHAADVDDIELNARILEGTQFVLVCAEVLLVSPRRLLGSELHQQVLVEIAGHTTAVRVSAEKLVAKAQREYRKLAALVPTEKLDEVLRQRDHGPQHGDIHTKITCPACGNHCWAYWQVEYDGSEEHQVESVLSFLGIECPSCFLQLSASQCDSIELNPDGDPAADG